MEGTPFDFRTPRPIGSVIGADDIQLRNGQAALEHLCLKLGIEPGAELKRAVDLAQQGIEIDVPDFGPLTVDVAYGGNFYAILEPQKNFAGLESMTAGDVLRYSPVVRKILMPSARVGRRLRAGRP